MPTLLSADPLGKPLPEGISWQEDLERNLPYFSRVYGYRFRYLTPELREEQVQEALAQTAAVFASQYRMHGGRTEYRHRIGRYIVGRVKRGTQFTRPYGRNADLLDRTTLRTAPTTPQRALEPLEIIAALESPRPLSPEFRLDLETWIDTLPDRLREYATLAYRGTPEVEMDRIMGIKPRTAAEYRRQLRLLWQKHLDDQCAAAA